MSWQPPPPPNPNAPQSPASATKEPEEQTLYQLLQVDSNAHPTIIRYAYRYLAGIYHPDNAESGNPELFRIISDAFRVLADQGKRQAYDAQLGVKASKTPLAPGQKESAPTMSMKHTIPEFPKTGVSYNEVEMRLAILQVLLTARKKRAQTGGASAKVLMDVLNVNMPDMEFMLWYLREKGYCQRTESAFMITVAGVDYLVDSLAKTQVIDDGGKSGGPTAGMNLPARLE